MTKEFEMELEINKMLFYKEDTIFGIYSCDVIEYNTELTRNDYGKISLQGNSRKLTEGERYKIKFQGTFNHAKYGDFYKIVEVEAQKLDTLDGQDKFLREIISESHLASLKKAYPNEKLVDFILEGKVDVKKTKGIKEKTLAKIIDDINANMHLAILMTYLSDLDIPSNKLSKILAHFKNPEEAMQMIETNIYALCDIKTFGFKTVDDIALRRGDDPNSAKRIEACIRYTLNQDTGEGHTWSIRNHLLATSSDLLNLPMANVEATLNEMDKHDIYQLDDRVGLSYIRRMEKRILDNLIRIKEVFVAPNIDNIEIKMKTTEAYQGFQFTDEQRKAIIEGSQHGVMIMNGVAGSGKCIKGDSLVFTDKGMLRIEDIPKYYDVNEHSESEAKIISYTLNGEREIRDTSHFYNMGESKTIKIETTQGYTIEGTPEHPLLTVSEHGDLVYVKLQDFNKDTVVCLSKNNQMFGESNTVDEDMGYVMGLLVGDGSLNYKLEKRNLWRISLANFEVEIYSFYNDFIKSRFMIEPLTYKKKNSGSTSHVINSKEVVMYFKDILKMPMTVAQNKYIPETIMTAPKEVVKRFLQGLFDTDGCCSTKGFEWSTSSERIAHEVHTMLLNFGIVTKLRTKVVKGYEQNTYWILNTSNRYYMSVFEREIGFRFSVHKKQKLREYNEIFEENPKNIYSKKDSMLNLNVKIRQFHRDSIINIESYKNPTYQFNTDIGKIGVSNSKCKGNDKSVSNYSIGHILNSLDFETSETLLLKNVSSNMFLDKVTSIEESESTVYDFTVPETHSFVANGIINHNTATVKALVDSLGTKNYMTCGLSGKSVQVLAQRGITSSTIHRMLGFEEGKFVYDEESPLPYSIVVVDESSMISVSLMNSVIQAVRSGAKLIIVGDSGQLPAIGYGDVLRDLLSTQLFPTFELTQVHRQAAQSGILSLANSIRKGIQPFQYDYSGTETFGELQDQTVISYANKDNIPNDIVNIAKAYSQRIKSPSDLFDFQVIVSNRERGALSVKSLNIQLQAVFNDMSKPTFNRNGYEYREGDKIITQGNAYGKYKFNSVSQHYEMMERTADMKDKEAKEFLKRFKLDLFNGTMGYIHTIDKNSKMVFICIEGAEGVIGLGESELDKIDMAYAATCHKLQGSGIKNVIFALDYGAYKLLSKQLVYTALTRASVKGVALVENNAFHAAIGNDASGNRRTFLADLIKDELDTLNSKL